MSIDYYNNNAEEFITNTINVDMSSFYKLFLSLIPDGGSLLDAGCGSGRDAKYFLEQGYQVDAYDASEAMAGHAAELTGLQIPVATFDSFEPPYPYDGIWACASLLHVPKDEFQSTFDRLLSQLKPKGVLYLSMKYGHDQHSRHGRTFTDLDEIGLEDLLNNSGEAAPVAIWVSEDKRPDRTEQWLNAIVRYVPKN